jgi:hypothetical protein
MTEAKNKEGLMLARFSVGNKRIMVESLHGLLVVNPANTEQPPNVVIAAWLGSKAKDYFINPAHTEMVLDGKLPRFRELALQTDGFVRLGALPDQLQHLIWEALGKAHEAEVKEQEAFDPETPGVDVHGSRSSTRNPSLDDTFGSIGGIGDD